MDCARGSRARSCATTCRCTTTSSTRFTVCQLVIDIAGELSAQRLEAFEDYTQAVRNLSHDRRFSPALVERLALLPGFRSVVIHEHMQIDFDRVAEALNDLAPIEEFVAILRTIAAD